ncbi:MAG: hypothetical protein OHK0040_04140 [bacterium]
MTTLNKKSGFTLIEILVALGIAMVVIFSAYTLYFSLSKGTKGIYEKIKGRERAYNFLTLIRKEVESAYYFPELTYTGFKLEENDYYGKPASKLTFTSFLKEGTKILTYSVYDDNGKLSLIKTIQDAMSDERPVKFIFLKDIEGFKVRILDEGFDKVFDSNKLKKLPKTVKITLILKEGDKEEEYSDICEVMTAQ